MAQSVAEIPPAYVSADENGVDPVTGSFNFSMVEGSIGEGNEVLAMERYWGKSGWGDNWTGNLYLVNEPGQSVIYVSFGNISDKFTSSGSGYESAKGNGATITFNTLSGIYVYTAADGTVITYREPYASSTEVTTVKGGCKSVALECALPETIVRPDGYKVSLNWDTVIICEAGDECYSVRMRYRLKTVSDNRGYKMDISYMADGNTLVAPPGWALRKTIKFRNGSVDYSGTTGAWPTVTYNHSVANQLSITDAAGRLWRFTTSGIQLTGIKSPANSVDNVTVAYGTNGVTSVNDGTSTWTYNRTVSGTTATTIRTDGLGQTRKTISNLSTGRPTSVENELGKITSLQYDAKGRLTRITRPENDYTTYAYNARGNVLTTTSVGKPSSGVANIVTSATYPTTCANPVTCNKPITTTDAKGQVTDYVYDSMHGGVTSVTLPAATTGAVRPQTRYAYSALSAWLRTSPSTIAAGSPIYRLTSISACATTASCTGAASESKTVIAYQTGSASAATNLLPVSVSARSGDSALVSTSSFTWDDIGNRLTVDGPLTGTADTTRFRYDAARQVEGIVGPDPDGSAARKHQATRLTYNGDGLVTKSEAGTVDDQSDTAWTAFAPAETVTSSYNVSGLKTKDVLSAGGTDFAAVQYSYDATGQLQCAAQRMNPAIFGSLPASACTMGTAGTGSNAFGPDRIVRNSYDAAGRITKVQTAYGVSGVQADEVTTAYTNNGQVDYVIDAENNRTEYSYDGHDRLAKTEYPSATKGANAANASDYEQFGYDANGNVTSRRLRDGTSIGYGYDNLGRVVSKDLPTGETDITYAYDLLSRPTGVVQGTQTLSFTHDALGRNRTQVGPQGTITYGYDAANRRTSMVYPGSGLTINYDYDITGNVTKIRENAATSGVGVLASYAFDNLGRRTSVTFGNGSVQSFGYDPVSRLSTLTNNLGGTATTHDLTQTFGYNPASQIASVTRSNDAYAWQAHYNVDRSYTINGLNRIMNVGSTAFTYDGRGNLTNDGTNAFTYTSENLLKTGPASATLAYDPLGRLYQTVGGGVTTRLQYDGADLIAEYNASNALQRRYVHGPGTDNPIVWYEGSAISNATRRFLMADERGSVVSVTDSAGATVNINAYDEYGIPAPGNIGRFGYTGQAWLPELGMWYYKARMYSPTLGRFMQTDPIGYEDGMNWYNYVGSDPVNGSDSFGLAVDQKLKRLINSKKPIVPAPPEKLDEIVVTGTRQQPSPPLPPIPIRDIGWPSDSGFFFRNVADNNAPAGKPEKIECSDLKGRMDQGTLGKRVDEIIQKTKETGLEHGVYGGFDGNGRLWMTVVYPGTVDSMGTGAWVLGSDALRKKGVTASFLIHSHPSGNLWLSPGDRSQLSGKGLTVVAMDVKRGSACQAPRQ